MQNQQPIYITLNGNKLNLSNVNYEELKSLNALEWWQDIIDFIERLVSYDPYIELQTSGSTGEPKKFPVEKFKLFNSARKTVDYFQLNEKSTALLCLSVKYIAGQMMIVRAIISGMNLICVEPSSNPLKELHSEVDFTAMVSMQVKNSISELRKAKKIIVGGGKVEDGLVELLKDTGVEAYETFGMTETLSHIAFRKISPIVDEYFTPLLGISVSQGYSGELLVDYPDLGLYRMLTNDIVEMRPNGSFKWLGRKDFIINTGCVKVSPEVVECEISHLFENSICISSIPDEELGEKVVLVIESEPYTDDSILNEISNVVDKFHCPKEVIFVKEFPRTPNGKIQRLDIKKLILG